MVTILLAVACATNNGTFSLVNKTDESITWALVAICGQNFEFKGIQPGESALGSYRVKSDCHYSIEIEFQSDKKIRKETGYVTNGFDFEHEITVTDSGIAVTNTKTN